MIIDAHAHICTPVIRAEETDWYKKKNPDNSQKLIEHMDAHGISKVLLQMAHSVEEAEIIQAAVKKYPDRFMAFCSWGSKKSITGKEAADIIEKLLEAPQFRGVGEILLYSLRGAKGFETTVQDVMREMRLVMDVVAAHKVPILFHTGFSGAHSGKSATPVVELNPVMVRMPLLVTIVVPTRFAIGITVSLMVTDTSVATPPLAKSLSPTTNRGGAISLQLLPRLRPECGAVSGIRSDWDRRRCAS